MSQSGTQLTLKVLTASRTVGKSPPANLPLIGTFVPAVYGPSADEDPFAGILK